MKNNTSPSPSLFSAFDSRIYLQSFGSSSSGNCTCVWDTEQTMLIDCGFSPLYIKNHLKKIGRSLDSIQAVFITHLHTDHFNISAVNFFLKSGIPLYCHEKMLDVLLEKFGSMLEFGSTTGFISFSMKPLSFGNIHITPFPLPHDAEGGCFGYSITKGDMKEGKKLVIATDLVHTPASLLPHFINSDFILLEANYDPVMLAESGRPHYLIKRIREHGHLSNEASAAFLINVLQASAVHPQAVMLGHVSKDCNTNQLAHACVKNALARHNIHHIRLVESYRNQCSEIVEI